MATTLGNEIRTVADIVKKVMDCSDKEANEAEMGYCKSPANQARLLAACGLSTASVGYGGRLVVAGAATGGSTAIVGVVLTAAGLIGARRFCTASVKRAAEAVSSSSFQP